jgi:hypothetical protein
VGGAESEVGEERDSEERRGEMRGGRGKKGAAYAGVLDLKGTFASFVG